MCSEELILRQVAEGGRKMGKEEGGGGPGGTGGANGNGFLQHGDERSD